MRKPMQLSAAGLSFIETNEQYSRTLYNDAGRQSGNCSIGWGHLVHYGVCNLNMPVEQQFRYGVTKMTAQKLLSQDIACAVAAVNHGVTVSLNQYQFDALVDFCYNIGSGNFHKSMVLSLVNRGLNFSQRSNAMELNAAFLSWKTSNGKLLPGLTKRRQAEYQLFIHNSQL